jgi:hypothetical protein
VRSTGSRAPCPLALRVRHRGRFVLRRDRVASAPEDEARTRSRSSGPSVDESTSLYGQRLARLGLSHVFGTFRDVAATAVRGGRWESTRRAVWPLAPAVGRSSRSAAAATAATSTAGRSAPASPAATVSAARGAAIDTAPKVVWITETASGHDAGAAGRPRAWGITVPPRRPPPPICPPRSRRPPRMLRSRLCPRPLGPRPDTAPCVDGRCASRRPSAGPSAGSCPHARDSAAESLS